MNRVLAIIQARLGSTRLPRKALMDIGGKPMIQHVVERVQQIRGVHGYLVAAPTAADASALGAVVPVATCGADGIGESDVLGRFAAAVIGTDYQTILRVTGDCPLLDPVIASQVLALYFTSPEADYASNIAPGYRDGEDVEVFSRDALLLAHRGATELYDREHVTPWMRRHCVASTLMPAEDRGGIKTSVDTLDDLERVRRMVAGV